MNSVQAHPATTVVPTPKIVAIVTFGLVANRIDVDICRRREALDVLHIFVVGRRGSNPRHGAEDVGEDTMVLAEIMIEEDLATRSSMVTFG